MNNDLILELNIDETINSLNRIMEYVNNIKNDSQKIRDLITKINSDWESSGNDITSITDLLLKEIDRSENNIIPNMTDFTNSMHESLENIQKKVFK